VKRLILVVFLTVLTACAGKQLTRQEQLAWLEKVDEARTRVYDIDAETLINIAEQALLSFEDDYVLSHTPDGFVAHRHWVAYMIIAAAAGEDYWYVNTKKTEDNRTWIQVKTHPGGGFSASAAPTGGTGGGGSAVTVPYQGALESSYTQSPGLYNLFFNRIDFILGLTKDLIFCGDVEKYSNMDYRYNTTAALCSMGDDKIPTNAKQPAEVMEYYKKLRIYKAMMRTTRQNTQAVLIGEPPAKPWE
jgi:hypothetical protein